MYLCYLCIFDVHTVVVMPSPRGATVSQPQTYMSIDEYRTFLCRRSGNESRQCIHDINKLESDEAGRQVNKLIHTHHNGKLARQAGRQAQQCVLVASIITRAKQKSIDKEINKI